MTLYSTCDINIGVVNKVTILGEYYVLFQLIAEIR